MAVTNTKCSVDQLKRSGGLSGGLKWIYQKTRRKSAMDRQSRTETQLEIEEIRRKRLKSIHYSMLYRCLNKKSTSYKNYGGRGIKVCKEWAGDFDLFYEWAISHGYASYLSIDRIDNDGDYCPDNCRWVFVNTQNNNKRNSLFVEYLGERLTVGQFAKKYKVPYAYVYNKHIKQGVPLEKL